MMGIFSCLAGVILGASIFSVRLLFMNDDDFTYLISFIYNAWAENKESIKKLKNMFKKCSTCAGDFREFQAQKSSNVLSCKLKGSFF